MGSNLCVRKQLIMGAGLGGTKWAKIHERTNNKFWALGWEGGGGGGTKWAKIHERANNKLWSLGWWAPNGLKTMRVPTINYVHRAGGAQNGLKFTRVQTINYRRRFGGQ